MIKKNDNVLIISGKDKGKKGKIIQTFPDKDKVVVEGANKFYKHTKAKRQGEKGQKIEFFAPMKASKVMLVCPKCSKPIRIGTAKPSKGKKKRACKKCNETFD